MLKLFLIGMLCVFIAQQIYAQASKLCRADVPDTNCPAVSNDINNPLLKTDSLSGTVTVTGTIMTRPPAVPNSMVYKDASGTIMTTNGSVSNPGTPSETTNLVNVSILNNLNTSGTITANVLNGSSLQLTSSTLPTCNASNFGRVGTSGTKICVCDGTTYRNLLGGTNLITGLLAGTCP